jgi:hypothetical protein
VIDDMMIEKQILHTNFDVKGICKQFFYAFNEEKKIRAREP